jgi:hypothetical protein
LALASIAGDAAEIVAAAPAALSARVEHRFQLFKRLILESSVVEMEYLPPWHDPELAEWTIVGMNHYQQNGMRRLFVAMTRRGVCIQAEGKDAPALWEELRRQAAEQKYSPLDLSKAEHDGT